MKLLVIEDEEKLAKALKKGLEQRGFSVDYILDGEAGQRRLEVSHENYDAVLLDLMLPNKDGMTICRDIRKQEITVPILILTARDALNEKVTGLNYGADDYLTKPFEFEELIARVNALLRRPNESLPPELKIGNLRLNTTTRMVYYNGKQIPLTLKEFGLLEYFMRHPNQVLTRDQIIDHLWDFGFDSFSNVVDVHIKNLRKKINYGTELLETIRGVGYRLKA